MTLSALPPTLTKPTEGYVIRISGRTTGTDSSWLAETQPSQPHVCRKVDAGRMALFGLFWKEARCRWRARRTQWRRVHPGLDAASGPAPIMLSVTAAPTSSTSSCTLSASTAPLLGVHSSCTINMHCHRQDPKCFWSSPTFVCLLCTWQSLHAVHRLLSHQQYLDHFSPSLFTIASHHQLLSTLRTIYSCYVSKKDLKWDTKILQTVQV